MRTDRERGRANTRRIPETIPTEDPSLSLSLYLSISPTTTSLKSPGLVLFILRYPNDYPWNASFSFGLRAVGRLFAMAAAIHKERRRREEQKEEERKGKKRVIEPRIFSRAVE